MAAVADSFRHDPGSELFVAATDAVAAEHKAHSGFAGGQTTGGADKILVVFLGVPACHQADDNGISGYSDLLANLPLRFLIRLEGGQVKTVGDHRHFSRLITHCRMESTRRLGTTDNSSGHPT